MKTQRKHICLTGLILFSALAWPCLPARGAVGIKFHGLANVNHTIYRSYF